MTPTVASPISTKRCLNRSAAGTTVRIELLYSGVPCFSASFTMARASASVEAKGLSTNVGTPAFRNGVASFRWSPPPPSQSEMKTASRPSTMSSTVSHTTGRPENVSEKCCARARS